MYITEVPSKGKKGKSYLSILLRESYRVGAQVKSRTLAILTHLPAHVLAAVRHAIKHPKDTLAEVAQGSRSPKGPTLPLRCDQQLPGRHPQSLGRLGL